MYIDFHTHRRLLPENSVEIISVHPGKQIPGEWFTVGYHPWWTDHLLDETQINKLKTFSEETGFLAIGECGLDRLKGPALDIQTDIFVQHIELANTLQCPLIVHCVRAFNEVVTLKKQFGKTPWIIHGFVRNKILAKQLLDHDIFLSVAPHTKLSDTFKETLSFLPLHKMFLETDSEYSLTIAQRYQIFADIRGMKQEDLQHQLFNNFCTFFSWKKNTLRLGLNEVNY